MKIKFFVNNVRDYNVNTYIFNRKPFSKNYILKYSVFVPKFNNLQYQFLKWYWIKYVKNS